jgi:hypothetical protein
MHITWQGRGCSGALLLALATGGVGCEGGNGQRASAASTASASSAAELAPSSSSMSSATVLAPASAPASASSVAPATPPGEGPIAKLLSDALANPAPYNGKPVKVEGVFVSATPGDIGALTGDSYQRHPVVNVLIADSKDDVAHGIICQMNTWVPPPGLEKLGAVTAEGRGYMTMPAAGVKLVIGSCKVTLKAP